MNVVRVELEGLDPAPVFRVLRSVVHHCGVLTDAPIVLHDAIDPACADVVEVLATHHLEVSAIEADRDRSGWHVRLRFSPTDDTTDDTPDDTPDDVVAAAASVGREVGSSEVVAAVFDRVEAVDGVLVLERSA